MREGGNKNLRTEAGPRILFEHMAQPANTKRRAPGPHPLLSLIRLGRMKKNPALDIEELVRRYGEIVRLRLGPYRIHVVSNPEAIKYVLSTNNANYRKSDFYQGLVPALGQGLVTSDGDLWRRQRRTIQPAFQRERIAGMLDLIVRETEKTVSELEAHSAAGKDEPVEMDRLMMKLTFDIIGRAMFSRDVSEDSDEMYAAIGQSQKEAFHRALAPIRLPLSWPTRHNRRYRRAVATIDRIVNEMIEERKATPAAERPRDLLTMLLETRDEDGRTMSDRLVRDEAVTAMAAGHETTANALAWTWYLLSENPDCAERMQAEIEAVLGDRPPAAADLPRLEYTERVLLESMRLYPPVWLIERNTIEDDEILGYHIPAGTIVSLPQYAVHRDPALWEDPLRFDPDRFTPERSAGRPRFAYFPFGGGQRQCIGEHLALLEGKVILAMLGRRFRFRLLPNHPVETEPLVTMRPKYGLPMFVERSRRPAAAV